MSTTTPLPPALRARLAGVARRVRAAYLVRGLSVLVLILAILAGGAILTDYLLRESLPAAARGALLAVWLLTGAVLLTTLARRMLRPLDGRELAAVIESRFPELGERLTSSVDLCRHADSGSGSPALIALLVQETDARTGKLDLDAAIPSRRAGLLGGLAAVALMVSLLPAAVAPAKYARLAVRFFAPWHKMAPPADFVFAVEPGDAHAARGRPLTITAHLTPRDDLALPRKATLVVVGESGTSRHDMAPADDDGRYSATLRVPGDITYRVEAGNARSDDFSLSAVTPVDLAPDSPTVTVTPPAYAASALDAESLIGLVDVACLQHSDITLSFRFTRPAVAAHLEWTTAGGMPSLIALKLADDGTAAQHTLRADKSGTYRLLLDAEHGVRTERDGGAVTVRPDLPPAALKFLGPDGPRATRPYDKLPLEIRLADDIALAGADLEYRLNDEKAAREERMTLDGTREAAARLTFLLAGKVKPGDEVHYRVRFRDNLPKEFGGPHVAYHPADGWLKLRVVAEGGSLKEQDILARRDALGKRLDDILADLKQEQRKVLGVKGDTRGEESLNDADQARVAEARKLNDRAEKALTDLSREAAEEPGGDKLAEQARDVARQEMRAADQRLQKAAERGAKKDDRDQKFREAADELDRAMSKVDQMRQENERLAKERLAQARVEALADRQKQLAERAEELAKKDAPEEAQKVKREQDEVAKELQRLAESSPSLKKALDEARADQAREAADKARELAQAQRDLAKASDETERRRDAERLAGLAKRQEELAKRTEALAKDTSKPARAAISRPLETGDGKRAADSLAKGDAERAAREQEGQARELERLAGDLVRGAEQAKDPRTASRQLARVEEALMQKLRDGQARDSDEKLRELRREQEAVRESAEKLSVPDRADLQAIKKKGTEALAQAESAMEKKDSAGALAAMEKARQALRELSDKLPSLEQRREQSRKELSKLARDQDEAARLARDATKGPEAAKKQSEVTKGLEKLDAPGAEARRDKARDAAKKAEEQLDQKQIADARREMDKLGQALTGRTTEEAKSSKTLPTKEQADAARQLAREQRELSAATKKVVDQSRAERRADAAKPADESAGKQTREQAEIARDAERLAGDVSKEQGERSEMARGAGEAGKDAKEASRNLDSGALEKAQKAGQKTAEGLRKLAGDLAKTPRGKDAQGDTLEQARKLAQRQEAVNKAGESAASDPSAQRARQQARQAELAKRTADLGRELEELGQSGTKDAAKAARRAEIEMQAARGQAKAGNQTGTQTQREMAAKSLEQAAGKAQEASRGGEPTSPSGQAGRAMRQARGEMGKAGEAMGRNQPGEAGQSMRQAADGLQKAADQLSRAMQPDRPSAPNDQGAPGGGPVDGRALPKELAETSGKRWGELPGEVRTRITQQMKARYGDDYARMIKLYFEQVADTKRVR